MAKISPAQHAAVEPILRAAEEQWEATHQPRPDELFAYGLAKERHLLNVLQEALASSSYDQGE